MMWEHITVQRISGYVFSLESHKLLKGQTGQVHQLHFTDEKTMAQPGLEPRVSDSPSTHAAL